VRLKARRALLHPQLRLCCVSICTFVLDKHAKKKNEYLHPQLRLRVVHELSQASLFSRLLHSVERLADSRRRSARAVKRSENVLPGEIAQLRVEEELVHLC
jgi:hypothetical protein